MISKFSIGLSPGQWLAQELKRRTEKNPSYSLRAFARWLGIPSGRLSELLGGKRDIGPRLAARLSERLFPNPADRQWWANLVTEHQKERARLRKLSHFASLAAHTTDYTELSEDTLVAITDWYHYAILNLIRTDDFKPDASWIGARLNLRTSVVQTALKRLERLNLIKHENGTIVRTEAKLTTTQDVPSQAIREAHRQNLARASEALNHVPVDQRDITSICLTVSPDKLPQAKKLISNFRRNFAELMEAGKKSDVFQLSIAFFPLTRKVDEP